MNFFKLPISLLFLKFSWAIRIGLNASKTSKVRVVIKRLHTFVYIINEELPVHGHVTLVSTTGPLSWPSTLYYPNYHIVIVLGLLRVDAVHLEVLIEPCTFDIKFKTYFKTKKSCRYHHFYDNDRQ